MIAVRGLNLLVPARSPAKSMLLRASGWQGSTTGAKAGVAP